jgi:uncharacterized protein YjbI with pentapeptide repeats
VSEPVRRPYPPDREPGATPLREFGDLADAEIVDVDWANRSARRTTARRLVVRRSRFTGAELGESEFLDVSFVDCRLDLVGLRHATLQRVRFEDCRLTECDLAGSRLVDVAFERCELRGATFSNVSLERVSFETCDLLGLRGAEGLRGASMAWEDVLANAPTLAAALGIELLG